MKIIKLLISITVVSFPLYIIRCGNISYCFSPVPFTLLEVLIITTFIFWLGYLAKNGEINPVRLYQRLKNPLLMPATLLLIAAGLSVLITPDLKGGLGIFKAYFVEPIMLFFVVLYTCRKEKDIRWVLTSLIFSGFWLSVLAIFQGIAGFNSFAPEEAAQGRSTAVYNSANALGLYLGPIVAISIGLLLETFDIKDKRLVTLNKKNFWILILSLLLNLSAIGLTKSTGSFIALVATLLFWFVFLLYSRVGDSVRQFIKKALVLSMVIFLISIIWFFLTISYFTPNERFTYPRKFTDTKTIRLCTWEGTKNLLLAKPFLGVGLDGFHDSYPKYRTCDSEYFQYPHNIFLNFWAETGLLGLIAFIWISVVYARHLFGVNKSQFLTGALLAGLVYIWFHGLVDVPYFKNDLASQFWLLAALSVSAGERQGMVSRVKLFLRSFLK